MRPCAPHGAPGATAQRPVTEDQAEKVVFWLQRAFPAGQWRDGTVDLWVEELVAYDVEPAVEAAEPASVT